MADPEPADDPEAQPEAEELGTKPAQLLGQLGSGQVPFWHGDLDHQQVMAIAKTASLKKATRSTPSRSLAGPRAPSVMSS